MAQKKGGGSTRNGRDSKPKMLGVKGARFACNARRASATFRSGKTGEWKKYFKDEHKKIFKDIAEDLLIRLGYERDLNW